LRLFSFGGHGLALAALALVVFGAYDSYPSEKMLYSVQTSWKTHFPQGRCQDFFPWIQRIRIPKEVTQLRIGTSQR